MKKLLLSLVYICLISFTNQASAIEKKLNVQHFWQDNGCWCGVAVVEMVEQFYRGSSWKFYKERQANLAKPEHNGGIKVGHTSLGASRDNPCGSDGGVNAAEMLTILNTRLDEHGKRFKDGLRSMSGSPKQIPDFHSSVIRSIGKKDPVIFSGYTRYKDGTKKTRQHWYLIIGYKDTDGNPNTITHDDGYYIHDAAVGAGLSTVKTLGQKGKFVSHFNMMKYLVGEGNQLYYMVVK